jgi:hypothetical protein
MSTVKSKKLQVGTDATATNNFTIYQPATPDGTLRIGVGNADSPTERMRIDSSGVVNVGNNSGTGEVFAQNTVKAWGVLTSAGGTYNSFGISSTSKTSTGIYQINFSRTLGSNRFGMSGAGYATPVMVVGGAESTTGTQVRVYNNSGTLIDTDIQFLVAGGS